MCFQDWLTFAVIAFGNSTPFTNRRNRNPHPVLTAFVDPWPLGRSRHWGVGALSRLWPETERLLFMQRRKEPRAVGCNLSQEAEPQMSDVKGWGPRCSKQRAPGALVFSMPYLDLGIHFVPTPLCRFPLPQGIPQHAPSLRTNLPYSAERSTDTTDFSEGTSWKDNSPREEFAEPIYPDSCLAGSLVAQLVKNPPAMRETWLRSLGWEDPWRERLHTPVFWPGEFHGLYSPWGCQESDTTERLSLSFFLLPGDFCCENMELCFQEGRATVLESVPPPLLLLPAHHLP